MKNKIINFLFKKRIKILKSKKGFSLLEVLVAVGIIGIISAIALPRFQDYNESSALTATNTSANNIAKAYTLCQATKTTCSSLDDISINCPICDATKSKFYDNTAPAADFFLCTDGKKSRWE